MSVRKSVLIGPVVLVLALAGPSWAGGGGGGGGAGGAGGGGGSSSGGSAGGSGGGSSGSAGGGASSDDRGGGLGGFFRPAPQLPGQTGTVRNVPMCPPGFALKAGACEKLRAELMPDEELYRQGHDLALAGFYEEALPILETVSSTDDAMVYTMRGYATRKLGRWQDGMALTFGAWPRRRNWCLVIQISKGSVVQHNRRQLSIFDMDRRWKDEEIHKSRNKSRYIGSGSKR